MAEQRDTVPRRENVLALVLLAICDPGSFLPREREERDGETLLESIQHWGARAVLAAIDEDPVLEIRPYYPTQDAYDAACAALEKHRQRADVAEAAVERVRLTVTAGRSPMTLGQRRRVVLVSDVERALTGPEMPAGDTTEERAAGSGEDTPAYPAPGSQIPDQPGYIVGACGHRVAGSEWRAGFRTCERCPADGGEQP